MNVKKKLKEAAPIYAAIKANTGLRWLNTFYHPHSDDPYFNSLSEYEFICAKLKGVLRLLVWLVSGCLIVDTLIFLSFSWVVPGWRGFLALAFVCLHTAALIVFKIWWPTLVDAWIKAEWVRPEFHADVQSLVVAYKGIYKGPDDLLQLVGTGPETQDVLSIPHHVKEHLIKKIRSMVSEVLQMQENSHTQQHHKSLAKKEYELYKKFSVVPRKSGIESIYIEMLKLPKPRVRVTVG